MLLKMGKIGDSRAKTVSCRVRTYPNGNKFEGEWKDGKIWNGQGVRTYSSGNKFEGEWKDGERWNGKYYFNNGNIKTVVNGELKIQKSKKPDKIWVDPRTGFRLNLSEMDRKRKREECMKVAKLLPADDRLEYLRGCGLID